MAERLLLALGAACQVDGAVRDVETTAVPLEDRGFRVQWRQYRIGQAIRRFLHGIPADFRNLVARYRRAQHVRQQLRAEADAEDRLALLEHAFNRAQFGAQVRAMRLVGHVHGPPEHDQAAIPVHLGLRVWFAFEIGEADPVSTPPDQWISVPRGSAATCWKTRMRGMVTCVLRRRPTMPSRAGRCQSPFGMRCESTRVCGDQRGGRGLKPPGLNPPGLRGPPGRSPRGGPKLRFREGASMSAASATRMRSGLLATRTVCKCASRSAGMPSGRVDQGEIIADVDTTDEARLQVRFVGDRADDVPRLHTMLVADVDSIRPARRLPGAPCSRGARSAWSRCGRSP